jgi:hypothetical protein
LQKKSLNAKESKFAGYTAAIRQRIVWEIRRHQKVGGSKKSLLLEKEGLTTPRKNNSQVG